MAPNNLPGQLDSALGGQVFKLLLDIGVIETTTIPNDVFQELLAKKDSFGNLLPVEKNKFAVQTFVRLVQVKNKLSPIAEDILGSKQRYSRYLR